MGRFWQILLGVCCVCYVSSWGQGGQSPDKKVLASAPDEDEQRNRSAVEIPSYALEFKPQPAIPGVAASPVVASQMQCATDGTPFIDMIMPPEFRDHAVYSLAADAPHSYSVKTIADLHDIQFLRFFVGDSMVVILVEAIEGPPSLQHTSLSPSEPVEGANERARERHQYLA